MTDRISTSVSCVLHIALLALLSLISFRPLEEPSEPEGMEFEIIDTEHAMALPDPVVADQAPAKAMTEQAAAETPPQAEASIETLAAPLAQAQPKPIPQPSPQPLVAAPQPQPALRMPKPPTPEPKPPEVKQLGVGPVALPEKAAPSPDRATPQSAPHDVTPPAPAGSPAQAKPAGANVASPAASQSKPAMRLNASAIANAIAARTGPQSQTRLNSAAIGSAIGKAVPRGSSGLTVRQRVNLGDMIRSQITPCWNPPVPEDGGATVSVLMRIKLDRNGAVIGSPSLSRVKGETPANGVYARAMAGSVRRAVLRCSPLRLPAELYDAWADVELNFDPRDVS